MAASELLHLSIAEAVSAIRARQLSPVELVRAYLERIEKLNPSLHIYLTVTANLSSRMVKAIDALTICCLWTRCLVARRLFA